VSGVRVKGEMSWPILYEHGKGVFRNSGSLQKMNLYIEWIGENIGAESSRARTSLGLGEETAMYSINHESFPQGWIPPDT